MSPECGIAEFSPPLFVSMSWSTSIASIICLFILVHLNNLLFDELVDDVVKEVLKSSTPRFLGAPVNLR